MHRIFKLYNLQVRENKEEISGKTYCESFNSGIFSPFWKKFLKKKYIDFDNKEQSKIKAEKNCISEINNNSKQAHLNSWKYKEHLYCDFFTGFNTIKAF
jgi:hypothetical protein